MSKVPCPTCGEPGTPGSICSKDGAQLPNQRPRFALVPIAEGLQVGEYTLTQKLGEGGMGEVWKGVHPVIGKKVAVKLLNDRLVSNKKTFERFKREAKAVNEIQHRNVVDIFSFGELPDGRPYLIMELLEGKSLSAHIKESGPLPFSEIADFFGQICRALQAAHDRGIIHRDLKPDNIYLILEEGSPPFLKVLDFGIAKLADNGGGPSLTRTGLPFGTPAYMSPEQCEGAKHVDHRTDLYALGIVLFEMITGRTPFYAPGDGLASLMSKHKFQEPPTPSSKVQGRDVPPAVDALVLRLLAKEPDQRPSRCLDAHQELLAALGDKKVESRDAVKESRAIFDPPSVKMRPVLPVTEPAKAASAVDSAVSAAPPVQQAPSGKYYTGTSKTVQPDGARRRWPLMVGGGFGLVLAGGLVGYYLQTPPPPAPAPVAPAAPLVAPVAAPPPEKEPVPASLPQSEAPHDAMITVITSPAGARVYVFGQLHESKTPFMFKTRTGQSLDLRVELEGYAPQSRTINTKGPEVVQFALEPLVKSVPAALGAPAKTNSETPKAPPQKHGPVIPGDGTINPF